MSMRAGQVPRLLGLFLSLALCTGACTRDPSAPADDRVVDVSAARTVSTSDMSVSSATPDSATQDTTLDVVINGSGFVAGTNASWALAGVQDPNQVRTNSTRYVNSRQLIANITISASAAPAKWDIVVTAAGKKGGIGTEAFTVKARGKAIPDATPDFFLSNDNSYLLRGDGLTSYLEGSTSPYAGMSRYREGDCGVSTTIFNSPSTGSGDGILATAFTQDHKCRNFPRGVRIAYALINPDGTVTSQGEVSVKSFFNVSQIETPSLAGGPAIYIPVGSTESRGMNVQDNNGKCITLRFRPVLKDGRITGSDEVSVTRTSADTWIVRTQPDEVDALSGQVIHHDKAWCESSGALYHLPTMFVIHNSVPLSP